MDATTGTIDWTRKLFRRIGPMAVKFDQLYVVAGTGGSVYALNPGNGRGVWHTDLNSRIVTPPTVESHVHLVDHHGTWYALNGRTGEVA